jgi:branched-chain amino acid transport system ATP-binding protein
MLELHDAEIAYHKMEVIHQVSLAIEEGELVSVIGANGAGKTTLIKAMMGIVRLKKGTLVFKGQDITRLPAWRRAGLGIGYVPEGRRIFGELSVDENLRMGCYSVKDRAKARRGIDRAYETFPRLAERKRQLAKTMSGGEQQLLAIARALALEPSLLLVDEASMGLMPIAVNQVFSILESLHQQGITILVVEQNANKVLKIAGRGYLIETGRIMIQGSSAELRDNDLVRKAYLGE